MLAAPSTPETESPFAALVKAASITNSSLSAIWLRAGAQCKSDVPGWLALLENFYFATLSRSGKEQFTDVVQGARDAEVPTMITGFWALKY